MADDWQAMDFFRGDELVTDPYPYFDALRGDTAVYFYDFATRQTRVATQMAGQPQPYEGQISVSPDERSLLYSQTTENDADIMLVDGFQ